MRIERQWSVMIDSTAESNGVHSPTTSDSLLLTITDELAAERGVDPVELPPLYDYVDVDALATLFRPPAGGSDAPVGWVTFTVEACQVWVYHDGSVDVEPIESER